jgi:hypothetical protein
MNKMNLPAPFGAVTPTPPIVSKTVYNNHIILTTVQMVLLWLSYIANVWKRHRFSLWVTGIVCITLKSEEFIVLTRIWNCSLHQGNFHWYYLVFRGSKFHSWVQPFTLSFDCTPGPSDFCLKYKCNTIISLLNCFSV